MDAITEQLLLQFPVVAILVYLMLKIDSRLSAMQEALISLNETLVDNLISHEDE